MACPTERLYRLIASKRLVQQNLPRVDLLEFDGGARFDHLAYDPASRRRDQKLGPAMRLLSTIVADLIQ